jgi:hypothetical protein
LLTVVTACLGGEFKKERTTLAHSFKLRALKLPPKPELSCAEQDFLDRVTVRLIRPEERAVFDELLVKEHYLKNANLVGEQLRYVAEHDGQWVALFTWNAAAYNLCDRERWIGWPPPQKQRRLSLVVNNSRFVVRIRVPYSGRRRALGVRAKTTTWSMSGPNNCGSASCVPEPARFCGGAICLRP